MTIFDFIIEDDPDLKIAHIVGLKLDDAILVYSTKYILKMMSQIRMICGSDSAFEVFFSESDIC